MGAAVKFQIGQQLRYKPGFGTYGYEDMLESDGRLPAEVLGFSRTRVRVLLTSSRTKRTVKRCVDAASLSPIVDSIHLKLGPAAPRGCDHEFADSRNCVKCGWTP